MGVEDAGTGSGSVWPETVKARKAKKSMESGWAFGSEWPGMKSCRGYTLSDVVAGGQREERLTPSPLYV
jgi:hypothetical protein